MKTIWKYRLLPKSRQSVMMPKGAKILTVQTQNENPCIWALCDTEHPEEERRFLVIPTGNREEFPADVGEYVGSFQMNGGSLVFHLFEVKHE